MRSALSRLFTSLQWRLTVLAVAAVVFALAVAVWLLRRELLETESRAAAEKLELIVRAASRQVAAAKLAEIYLRPDGSLNDLDAFMDLRFVLSELVEHNGLTGHHGSPLYVLRPTADPAQLEFVVMPQPDAQGRWFVGNRYPLEPHLRTALAGQVATTGIYTDAEGQWISAAAPVRDAAGRVVAVVQADRQVDFIARILRDTLVHVSANLLVVALLVGGLAAWLGRQVSRPVRQLTAATERLAAGDLAHRVPDHGRSDELGLLARRLNHMAAELELARQQELTRQQTLQAALRESEAVNRAKGQFIAVTSHEMRTPLTAIVGFTQILLESPLPASALRHARHVLDAGEALTHLVNEVLDQSKIEAGTIQLDRVAVSLDELADRVTNMAEPQTVVPQNTLCVELAPEVPALVLGSPKHLQQVLLNLVSNAIKFARGGWVCLRITTEPAGPGAAAAELRIRFEVEDNGIGIAPEHHAKIFTPFYQVSSASNRAHGGAGLGLSIAAGLVRVMGGELQVASEVGRGTRFWFTIPLLSIPAGTVPRSRPASPVRRIALVAGHDVPAKALASRLRRTARLLHRDAEVEVVARLTGLPRDGAGQLTRFDTILVQSCTGLPVCPRVEDGHWHPACDDCEATPTAAQQEELRAWRRSDPVRQLWLSTPAARRPDPASVTAAGYDGWFTTSPRQEDFSTLFSALGELPGAPGSPESAASRNLEVMVAEDYEPNRVLLEHLLRGLGVHPVMIAHGDQVLPALQARRPAMLLLDLHMPGVDGFEIAEEWRAQERAQGISGTRRLPIVAVSASVLEADRQRAINLGMNDFIEKPIDPHRLQTVLGTWLSPTPRLP